MKTREEYITKTKLQLDKLDARIAQLEADLAKKEVDAKSSLETALDELKSTRKDTEQKLGELKKSTDDAWQTLKEGTEHLIKEAEGVLDDTRSALTGAK